MKLSPEERVLVQWRTSFGCPIADEAKAQFAIECHGHTFVLADVRLWLDKHQQRKGKELTKELVNLEFFFDGQLAEIQDDPAVFEKAFENLIENQLQARRMAEFRKKLSTRRRAGTRTLMEENEDAEASAEGSASKEDHSEWRSYLHKPVLPTQLSVRSMREAGCMIRFIVCQTSISVSASEELGQLAFPEHFPIDGKEQEIPVSTKPLPKWVYALYAITAIFTLVTVLIMCHVFKEVFTPRSAPQLLDTTRALHTSPLPQ